MLRSTLHRTEPIRTRMLGYERYGLKKFKKAIGIRRHSSFPTPQLHAHHHSVATELPHVNEVDRILKSAGILNVVLDFQDRDSDYLRQLVLSLNKYHDHGLPITHSATRGWFWDVKPAKEGSTTDNQLARSETMEDFPWHTDCSYESSPPRFFALQVLQPDRYGGGTLSVLKAAKIVESLSSFARKCLALPEYVFLVPDEFDKGCTRQIVGSILGRNTTQRPTELRFRQDIITPLTERAAIALRQLREVIFSPRAQSGVLSLGPQLLPAGSVIIVDNRQWLHARNQVKDPSRHLRRVRWDASLLE